MADQEVVRIPDEVIALVGRLVIENALLQQRLAQQGAPGLPPGPSRFSS